MQSSRRVFQEFRRQLRSGAAPPQTASDVETPPASRWTYLREYLAWIRPFAGTLIGLFLLASTAAALGLILPRATMYIVDVLLPAGNLALLHTLGLGLLGVILVQQSLDFLRNWQTAKLNARLLFRLRQHLYDHLLRLPLHQLGLLKTGGITSRLSGDIDAVTGLLQMGILTPAVALAKIILTVTVLVWIDWRMSLAAILLLPPIALLNLFYLRRVRPIYRSMRHDRQDIDARVVETFGGIRVVRAFGREFSEARRYAQAHHTVIRKRLLARFLEFLVWSGWGVMIPMCSLLIVWLGGTFYLQGSVTIGGIIAFQMYVFMLLQPVSSVIHSYAETQRALAALERIFDLLRQNPDKPDHTAAQAAPATVESFAFDNVTFGYQPAQPVLHDFTLAVHGGKTIALVGPSGCGKTTVTNLVARFYDPDRGAVRLNGIDLRHIRLRDYRRLLGLVQQDVFLFDGTIAENIAYARPHADPQAIIEAARRAHAHEFIQTFPAGYETLVGERGVRLSGGQAQRISIARAILANPRILILDEATSNLDSESEQYIQDSLTDLLKGRTTFVIAHRLSTIEHADLIVVMHEGRIMETGTHQELLNRDTRYRAMVLRQQHLAAAGTPEDAWLT